MACNQKECSSSVGKRVSGFFQRLVKANKNDNTHSCFSHDSVNRAVDLYRKIEASDDSVREKRSARMKKGTHKRKKKAPNEKTKSENQPSAEELGNEHPQANSPAANDTGRDGLNTKRGAASNLINSQATTADVDKTGSSDNHHLSRFETKEKVINPTSKMVLNKEDGSGCQLSRNGRRGIAGASGHSTDNTFQRDGVKSCSNTPARHTAVNRHLPLRQVECLRNEARSCTESDLDSKITKPAQDEPAYQGTKKLGVGETRRIRAKTCTVREPTFVWRESDDGLETRPVGMAKKKIGKKKTEDEYADAQRPETPQLLSSWSSDSDPLDGLEELLDDAVRMEERYTERRRQNADTASKQTARKNKMKMACPHPTPHEKCTVEDHKITNPTAKKYLKAYANCKSAVRSDWEPCSDAVVGQNTKNFKRKTDKSVHNGEFDSLGNPNDHYDGNTQSKRDQRRTELSRYSKHTKHSS